MRFAVRSAATSDIPAMHRIRLSVRENRLSAPGRVAEASYLPYVEAGCAWVAAGPDGITGFAALDPAERTVWALFVAPDWEGAGVGKALLEAMVAGARERGLGELRLSTGPGTRAARFYRAAGWTEAGLTANGELALRRGL